MSRLIDNLERLSAGRAQPLGFSAAMNRVKTSPMLVVASVPAGNKELATLAADGGADALLSPVRDWPAEKEALARMGEVNREVPWGVSLESPRREQIEQLIELGCDFVLLTPGETPASVLHEEKIGKVLSIDPSLEENLVRAISRLSIDAVVLNVEAGKEPVLTVRDLMAYERLATVAGKHIIAVLPAGLPADDLESLWGLGVRAVVLDMSEGQPAERLAEIKERMEKLPQSRKRSSERFTAVLPRAVEQPAGEPSEDDDEDDDY
jgi:hypothetical protein